MSVVRRSAMTLVGVAVFLVYALGAALVFRLLAYLWTSPPGPLATAGIVLVVTLVLGVVSYRLATAQLLASIEAVELSRRTSPRLFDRLDALRRELDVPEPRVLVADLAQPNAFALASVRGGAVVIDRQLFDVLDAHEMTGILAHELAHIESNDGLVQTLAYSVLRTVVALLVLATLPITLLVTGTARAVAWASGRPSEWPTNPLALGQYYLSRLLVGVLVAFTLLVRAHSRRREYAADDRAVEATGDPVSLARALAKIHRAADPEFSLLSPLYVDGDESDLTRLLSTHPPMRDRIERLVEKSNDPNRPVIRS